MRLREGLRSNRRCDVSALARIMEDYAFLCIYAPRRNALNSADEHVQTSGEPAGPNIATALRLARRGLGAQKQHAGLPALYAASGPEPGTWKDPDPRRRSNRGYATPAACPVSVPSEPAEATCRRPG